jgi:hypothetical protein
MHSQQLTSGPLLLVLEKRSDRWAHRLFWQKESERILICESQEGTSHDAWPPSPPLQEIHFETHGNSRVAMGVGMSGSSHWSICISADTRIAELRFEVACRTKNLAQFLGSSYRFSSPETMPHGLVCTSTLGNVAVNEQSVSDAVFSADFLASSPPAMVRFLPPSIGAAPAGTICWNYSISSK